MIKYLRTMKTLIALTTFAVATLAEMILVQPGLVQNIDRKKPDGLTDEIRRYDNEDLILQ